MSASVAYHDREYDGSHSGLEDPEQCQTEHLHEGEQVHLPEGYVPQVDQVWLMLSWHQKQLQAVHELRISRKLTD